MSGSSSAACPSPILRLQKLCRLSEFQSQKNLVSVAESLSRKFLQRSRKFLQEGKHLFQNRLETVRTRKMSGQSKTCPDNLETVQQPQNCQENPKTVRTNVNIILLFGCARTMRSEVIELLAKLQYTALRFPVDLSSLRGQSRVHLGWGRLTAF